MCRVDQRAHNGQRAVIGHRHPGGQRVGAGQGPIGARIHDDAGEMGELRTQTGQGASGGSGRQFQRTDGGGCAVIAAIDDAHESRAGPENQTVRKAIRESHGGICAPRDDRPRIGQRGGIAE